MEPGVEHGGCANGQMEGGEDEREKWTASSTEVRGAEQDVGDVGLPLVCWCRGPATGCGLLEDFAVRTTLSAYYKSYRISAFALAVSPRNYILTEFSTQ